jgi:lysophospholipase L1-like esterase
MWLAADTAAPASPPPAPKVMLVYGDSYAGADHGGDLPTGWAATVGRQLGLEVVNDAVSGSGYRVAGWTSIPYEAVAHPVRDASVVVLFGGLNDYTQPPESVRQEAVITLAAIRSWTDAPILMIGPQWPNANRPDGLLLVRNALASAAYTGGATWVDASTWFDGRPELIQPDGWHPNVAGHAYLADKIRPLVAAALEGG